MKSRLTLISLLLIYCNYNLTFAASMFATDLNSKKVYIILRSEQSQDELTILSSKIQSDLLFDNIHSKIEIFRIDESIPQMRIFKKAYTENFDYLLLIDQVAKYNIGLSNRKVNIGSKFKIHSYALKTSQPKWSDLGDTDCNITVDKSIQKLSKKISTTVLKDSKITTTNY